MINNDAAIPGDFKVAIVNKIVKIKSNKHILFCIDL